MSVPFAVQARTVAHADRCNALRVGATALVVLIHASTGPDGLAFRAASLNARMIAGAGLRVAASLAVPTFLLLAFMQMHPATGGRADRHRILQRCRRIVPVYLFWTALYATLKFVGAGVQITPSVLAEYIFLGGAAAHLYFLPLLVVLTASLPVWLAASRRLTVAVPTMVGLATGAWYVSGSPGLGPVSQAMLGVAGNAAYAIAGLAVVEHWTARSWTDEVRQRMSLMFAVIATVAGLVLAAHGAAEGLAASTLRADFMTTVARVLFPPAIVCATLSSRARFPQWTGSIAPLTFGIYLAHPLAVKALHVLELHLAAARSHELLLAIPNAILAGGATAAAVLVVFDTRLRRVVT